MDTRRSFIKKAAMLSTAGGLLGALPASVRRAFSIEPEPNTTWLDAEHVVILMQENRSFDHVFGSLQGVRGFNDPRAIRLPNDHPVWLQTNEAGETYVPFRLDIHDTNATWMGSLPHIWPSQVDALNGGKHDGWLDTKRSTRREYANMPLTLGYYTREDLPFYYAMADVFTICDQHFCSSLTGTMPNRLYLWSGTVRGVPNASAPARLLNQDIEYEASVNWTTFPERLEDNGISWKIYQNELSLDVGFTRDEAYWLSNFGNNALEWFGQFHAKFLPAYRKELALALTSLPGEIATLERRLLAYQPGTRGYQALRRAADSAKGYLRVIPELQSKWSLDNFTRLSAREKSLFVKAFSTNVADPFYHEMVTVRYEDRGKVRQLKIPRGDILHQFRKDVESGALPAVSWVVAPQKFSDHPGAPWFGAWYVSEVMDILTRNPEVWKKTVFILTYDENDGYFDHIPPFAAPHPRKPETGVVSKGINVEEDFVTREEELKYKSAKEAREHSIGLGFRVPMIVASPWSRGGYVCSQVFDHTSVVQFLEKFTSHKARKQIKETNISEWRRTVCGDLTSIFRPHQGKHPAMPARVVKQKLIEQIHRAQFNQVPSGYKPLTREEIQAAQTNPRSLAFLARQEPGTRPACALPYELSVAGRLNRQNRTFEITFACGNEIFGTRAAGAPFRVYAPGRHLAAALPGAGKREWEYSRNWAFAVAAGSTLQYEWPLEGFESEALHLRVHGPNGFYREFKTSLADPLVEVQCRSERSGNGKNLTGDLEVILVQTGPATIGQIEIRDNSYKLGSRKEAIGAEGKKSVVLKLKDSFGWYDVTIRVDGTTFEQRFAGRIETGATTMPDPAMGSMA